MRQKSRLVRAAAEEVAKDIRRATRRDFSAEGRIRIVLEGKPVEESIAGSFVAAKDRPEPLLPLVEGISRRRQEAARWRRGAGCHLGRGEVLAKAISGAIVGAKGQWAGRR